ncbi:hypothetical protein Pfo_017431 [Paulownia fortunei]|nr:hypothetical protein Pfo_017431 [Paulownia fortunei]
MLLSDPNAAGVSSAAEPPRFSEDIDSTCSTPFVSAPSSPGMVPPVISSISMVRRIPKATNVRGRDLSVRSTKYSHRKARSMSPLRFAQYEWHGLKTIVTNQQNEAKENESSETTPSCSASSSRSSSSGRNSKKWIFLKDLLHRSKSEGRTHNKERFWSAISFSAAKEKKTPSSSSPTPVLSPSSSRDEKKGKIEMKKERKVSASGKPANGVWRRRVPPSAHELHYTANRAQAEEMKKKTFLPYRQGLLGCLGFSSKSYGAFSGFTRNLNPISSR